MRFRNVGYQKGINSDYKLDSIGIVLNWIIIYY